MNERQENERQENERQERERQENERHKEKMRQESERHKENERVNNSIKNVRCKKGTTRNKKTGNCDPTRTRKSSPK